MPSETTSNWRAPGRRAPEHLDWIADRVRDLGDALELGTLGGQGTQVLLENCTGHVTSIDLPIEHFGTADFAEVIFGQEAALDRLKALYPDRLTLRRVLHRDLDWTAPIDVLFLDADLTFQGVSRDLRNLTPHLSRGGVFLLSAVDAPDRPGVAPALRAFLATSSTDWEPLGHHRYLTAYRKL